MIIFSSFPFLLYWVTAKVLIGTTCFPKITALFAKSILIPLLNNNKLSLCLNLLDWTKKCPFCFPVFKSIVEKIKDTLGDAVKDVKTTNRLSDSPSCVVKDPNDPMAQMAAMMKAMGQEVPETAPILEINPDHAIVKSLNGCADDDMIEDISWLLLDQAKMAEGIEIKDTVAFTQRLNKVMSKAF